MGADQLAAVMWRRRWIALTVFAVSMATVVAVTLALPRKYQATATLTVISGSTDPEVELDPTQSETLARTYTNLIATPNVADRALEKLRSTDYSRTELQSMISVAPIERTALITVTAEARSPENAQRLATTYAKAAAEFLSPRVESEGVAQRLTVLERASLPAGPAKPMRPLYIGVGGLIALFLAVAAALLRDRADPRLDLTVNGDQVLGLPILAEIPPEKTWDSVPGEQLDDAFRRLRTNLRFAAGDEARTIVVTSPAAAESKTSIGVQLAQVAAGDGERTVLVEGDLRRPALDRTSLGRRLRRREEGLMSVTTGQRPLREVIDRVPGDDSLFVVWAGSAEQQPPVAVGSRAMKSVLTALADRCRWVIVDSPPVSIGDDASILAARADGVLYVLDARHTSDSAARDGVAQLRRVGARILGVVVANAPAWRQIDEYYGPEDDA